MQKWDRYIPQAEMQLDILQASKLVPTISSYAHIYIQRDYNSHPLAPMHVQPEIRKTYGAHSVAGCQVGTSIHHYRGQQIYVTETNDVRVGDIIFHKH